MRRRGRDRRRRRLPRRAVRQGRRRARHPAARRGRDPADRGGGLPTPRHPARPRFAAATPYWKARLIDWRVVRWSLAVGIPATVLGALATRWIDGGSLVLADRAAPHRASASACSCRPGDPHEVVDRARRLPLPGRARGRRRRAAAPASWPTPAGFLLAPLFVAGPAARRSSRPSPTSLAVAIGPRRPRDDRPRRPRPHRLDGDRWCSPLTSVPLANLGRPGGAPDPPGRSSNGPTAPASPCVGTGPAPGHALDPWRTPSLVKKRTRAGVGCSSRPARYAGPVERTWRTVADRPAGSAEGSPEADPRGHGGAPAALLPGPARGGRPGRRHGLLGAPRRARRGQRGQGPQGPLVPRLLRHPGRRLRGRVPRRPRSPPSSGSPPTGRSRSSGSATWARPSPTTGASAPAASGSLALVDADPAKVGERIGDLDDRVDRRPVRRRARTGASRSGSSRRRPPRPRRSPTGSSRRASARSSTSRPAVVAVPDTVSLRKVDLAIELQILSFYQSHRSGPAGLDGLQERAR